MRWLAVKKRDGSTDEFAIALASHTVSKAYVKGDVVFTAWRLTSPATLLGNSDKAEGAKLIAEEDARGEKS